MQSFLIKLLTAIILPLLDKLWDLVNNKIQQAEQKKKDQKTAEEARQKMDKAKTAKEIDEASDDTLSGV